MVLSGLVLYGLGEIAEAGGWGAVSGAKLLLAGVMTAGLAVAAWVGTGIVAGRVKGKPVVGIVLMAIAALGLLQVVGFDFLSPVAVALLGLSAVLGIYSGR
jgi:hypothetical protein